MSVIHSLSISKCPPRKRIPEKHRFPINQRPHCDGVMISVLVYSVKSWSGKIKDYKISICCCYANLGCSCIQTAVQ